MGLNLKILKWALHYLHDVIQKALQTRLIISPMFLFAKTVHTVMTFKRKQPTPFCLEFNVLAAFSVQIGLEKVKYARITITRVCFIALTLAGSLGWCRTLGLYASCSNSILGTLQMLMHEKKCVIHIIYHECEGGIEKYVLRITVWHHKACWEMTNGDQEGQIFFYPILTGIMDSFSCSPSNTTFYV